MTPSSLPLTEGGKCAFVEVIQDQVHWGGKAGKQDTDCNALSEGHDGAESRLHTKFGMLDGENPSELEASTFSLNPVEWKESTN